MVVRPALRPCFRCGMSVFADLRICPKCNAVLVEQTDGSTLTADIAHQGERVHEALEKLASLIDEARCGFTYKVRLITGSGFIREAAYARLGDYQSSGDIKSFDIDSANPGVILVYVR